MEFKDALMEALKLEQDGRNFYARMAEEAPDEETRSLQRYSTPISGARDRGDVGAYPRNGATS